MIFDVSGSMSGDKVKRARDALSKFIQIADADEYFLIAFNSRAQLLLDRTRDGDDSQQAYICRDQEPDRALRRLLPRR